MEPWERRAYELLAPLRSDEIEPDGAALLEKTMRRVGAEITLRQMTDLVSAFLVGFLSPLVSDAVSRLAGAPEEESHHE